MESWLPLAIAAVVAALGYVGMGFDRARHRAALTEVFQSAIDRIDAGERNVRLDSPTWGQQAREVSAFNQIALAQELGANACADGIDHTLDRGASFRRLRESLRLPGAQADEHTFVALLEINRFATLRRSIGLKLASRVLRAVTEQIEATLPNCEIGRVGRTGIEFAFGAASVADGQQALEGLSHKLERRIDIEGFTFDLPISIGFADSREHSIREELIDHAAAALAKAQSSRIAVQFADHMIEVDRSFDDLTLMRDLPRAMQAGELVLHYQPKLRARTEEFDSVEALLRWFHPERGQVATDHLIELAESTGAIRDLTDWVVSKAVADQRALSAAGHDITVYINVSGVLLPETDFAERLLETVGASAGRIGLEITETAVIKDPDRALANLRTFTDAGLKIAIDDYGSGLSSLAYLKQLPANELKIDRMFISGLVHSNRDPLLVRSSIDLAHALEMEVTAEGVDDPMVLSLLRIMGCDLIQGYLVSPPLSLAELDAFLTSATAKRAAGESIVAPPIDLAKLIRR